MARILLIEDDNAVRTMLRLTLAHFGHSVVEARNGKEGLALFKQDKVDLVITDIVMPEKDGLEVLIALQKMSVPPVKVIAISGGGRTSAESNLRLASRMGAVKVFAKPISNEVLIAAIDELLSDDGAAEQMVVE